MAPLAPGGSESKTPLGSELAKVAGVLVPANPALCATAGCGKPGTMQCPICLKLKAPVTPFCSQDCFKSNFAKHASVHVLYLAVNKFTPPAFQYTGTMRPAYVSPRRSVPDHIKKPDYAITGDPISERLQKAGFTTPVYTPQQIKGIRAACELARRVLDMAANVCIVVGLAVSGRACLWLLRCGVLYRSEREPLRQPFTSHLVSLSRRGQMVKPGVLPEDIDVAVHNMTVENNAYPSPLNYYDFPKACCISVNEVVCHGIPDFRPLQDGDIVNVDISCYLNGYHGDVNETYTCGKVDDKSKALIKASHDSMMAAINEVKPNILFRDFGNTISSVCRRAGFSSARAYCGHGIGELLHAAPNIPHYANNKAMGSCRPGMVFTIEPMVNAGTWKELTW